MKLTSLEVLTRAGVENPEEVFGKKTVRIAGIRGIGTPGHVVNLQPGQASIMVGEDSYTADIGESEPAVSEAAHRTLKDIKAPKVEAQNKALAKAKKEAAKAVQPE